MSRRVGGRAYEPVRAFACIALLALATVACLGCTGDDDEPTANVDAGPTASGVIDFGDLPPFATAGRAGSSGASGASAGGTGGGAGSDSPADAGVDAASNSVPFDAGAVAISAGVLTNQPQLGFVNTGGDGIVIISAFIRLVEGIPAGSLLIHGELRNDGMVMRCIPIFDSVSFGGLDVLAVADAPAHYDPSGFGGSSYACLAPGAKGAFTAIENDVPSTLLDDATELRYEISALERDFLPHPSAPVLLSVDRLLDGTTNSYRINGQLRSSVEEIYNLKITFYAKNAFGLLLDDTDAFPRDLDTIPARTTLDYQSFPFPFSTEAPETVIHYADFIRGAAAPGSTSQTVYETTPATPELERVQRARALRSALSIRKERLHAR